jgi:hypothetical protein
MRLVTFNVAGGGGRVVHINPAQVVCLLESGAGRTQVVTTGLTGESSMSLIVDGDPAEVSRRLGASET